MTSEVDISNLALAHLGDSATVASIDPPEGSAQAEHCARFYPIARDSLLEQHDFKFNTRRVTGALLNDVPLNGWLYAYSMPANSLKVVAVLPPDALNDYSESLYAAPGVAMSNDPYSVAAPYSMYQPQDYTTETFSDGTTVIYTNQALAVIRYTIRVTDSAKFSPLFVDVLSWYLAGYLAGPIIKGDSGAKMAQTCWKTARALMGLATTSDANQQQIRVQHSVSWINKR